MKKIILSLIVTFFLLTFFPMTLIAKTEINKGEKSVLYIRDSSQIAEAAKAKTLIIRLNEIKMMEKSNLNSAEKKQLKNEVRAIKSELKALHQGIYLTAGELIIIILLLIILL